MSAPPIKCTLTTSRWSLLSSSFKPALLACQSQRCRPAVLLQRVHLTSKSKSRPITIAWHSVLLLSAKPPTQIATIWIAHRGPTMMFPIWSLISKFQEQASIWTMTMTIFWILLQLKKTYLLMRICLIWQSLFRMKRRSLQKP